MPKNEVPEANDINGIHAKAYEKAKEKMPELDINEIIIALAEVYFAKENRKKVAENEAKKFAEKYKKPFGIYLDAFCVEAVERGLNKIGNDEIKALVQDGIATNIVDTGKNIEKIVKAYLNGEMDEVSLIKELAGTNIIDIAKHFIKACGVDSNTLNVCAEQMNVALPQIAVGMLSVCALAASYKIMKQALDEAAVMRDKRLLIEEQCRESINLMRQYHIQMNESISNYLYSHAVTFNRGVAVMDQAILVGDVSGFIRGNTEIQEILNYSVQFKNEKQFDELMLSDTAFRL